MLPSTRIVVQRAINTTSIRMMSGERFGLVAAQTSNGGSGWTWAADGRGMGGMEPGPATEIKEGLGKGKDYPNPEFFKYNKYTYFDVEKDVVDSDTRVAQPDSKLTEFW